MDHVPAVQIDSGITMPLLGFGTARLRGEDGRDSVGHALKAGYRLIDTATAYSNEAEIGQAVRDSGLARDEVFITTKLPGTRSGQPRQALIDSLRRLRTDYVDLWLIHWPPTGPDASVRVWAEFLQARADGLCRAVGVSNYTPAQIDALTAATGQTPAVDQVRWSVSDHNPALLTALRDRQVTVEGFGPLKGTPLHDRVLVEMAAAHGVTPAQVALRWHLQLGIIVIPRSARRERIESNIDVLGFSLTSEEMNCLCEFSCAGQDTKGTA
jgi:2,5-diketo-D-gluconate reductase A